MDEKLAYDWVMFIKQFKSVIAVAMDNAEIQKALIENWHAFVEMDLKRIVPTWTFEEGPDQG